MTAAVSYPHIVFTQSLFQAEPHIEGLRIRVRDVVQARDQSGYTPEEIAATVYPDLSLAQVYCALANFEAIGLRSSKRHTASRMPSRIFAPTNRIY